MIELECEDVRFYAPLDEAAFFTWAETIPAVESVTGRGRCIVLSVKSHRVSNGSLRELLALFYRYKISMHQLARFRNARNEVWFAAPDKYWFKNVFCKSSRREDKPGLRGRRRAAAD